MFGVFIPSENGCLSGGVFSPASNLKKKNKIRRQRLCALTVETVCVSQNRQDVLANTQNSSLQLLGKFNLLLLPWETDISLSSSSTLSQ